MIRSLIFALALCVSGTMFAQPVMQASIGIGSTPTSVKIYIKPDLLTNGQISTLNFNIAIPASTPGPIPTLDISNNPFPGATFQILPPYVEAGFINYNIANFTPFNVNIAAGAETEMLEVRFQGNPANSANVRLLTLPDGGNITPFALFQCTGIAGCNGSALYYTRGGTSVDNQFSYTFPAFFPPGTNNSTATLSALTILPIKWLSFDAIRQDNDGLLNWKVSNEESNHHYVVQRSLNGTDFINIGTVNKNSTGSGIVNYTYTDPGITGLGVNIIYYRLQQVDIDGRNTFSDIRLVKLNTNKADITVFPNPVVRGFYVNVPLENPANSNVKLILISNSGQVMQSKSISGPQASNYYFDITPLSLAAGQYQLRIVVNEEVLKTVKLVINKE